MVKTYPKIPRDDVERQGRSYIACDAEGCDAEVEVEDVRTVELMRGRSLTMAEMPEGWATSDPDANAMAGAADFCPEHAGLIHRPLEELPPLSDG